MGMVAILVIWPGSFEQTFIPPSHWDSTWNLASTGSAVPEKMFENGGRRRQWTTEGWTTEPELKMLKKFCHQNIAVIILNFEK